MSSRRQGNGLTCCFFGNNSSIAAEPSSKVSWDSSLGSDKHGQTTTTTCNTSTNTGGTKTPVKDQPPAVIEKEVLSVGSIMDIAPKHIGLNQQILTPTQQQQLQQQQQQQQQQPLSQLPPVTPLQPLPLEALLSESAKLRLRNYDRMLSEYRVVRKLSSGTCAVVLLGVNSLTARKVAIKRQEKKGRNIRQIAREADLQLCLQHPNIAELLEISEGPSEVIIVQEFCGGGELFDAVAPEVGCALNVSRSYILQICRALEYLHSLNIAHRDIKPENIMLSPDKRMIKLIDFGLSERIMPPGHRYKRRVGTVPYMDPSLWTTGTAKEDQYAELDLPAIDVWAAGVVLFCMLCGRFPWAEATTRSLEYRKYTANDFGYFPWTRIGEAQLALLRGMLSLDGSRRFTAAQARQFVETRWPVLSSQQHKDRVRLELKMSTGSQGSLGVGDSSMGSQKTPKTGGIGAGVGATQSPIGAIGGAINVNPGVSNCFDFDIARAEAVVA